MAIYRYGSDAVYVRFSFPESERCPGEAAAATLSAPRLASATVLTGTYIWEDFDVQSTAVAMRGTSWLSVPGLTQSLLLDPG